MSDNLQLGAKQLLLCVVRMMLPTPNGTSQFRSNPSCAVGDTTATASCGPTGDRYRQTGEHKLSHD